MDNFGDYISRDDGKVAAWEILEGMGYSSKHNERLAEEVDAVFDEIPAADVRPVVRGKWYWDKDGMDWGIGAWRCSACKAMSPMWWNCDRGSPMHKSGHRFCPNCGARMEES